MTAQSTTSRTGQGRVMEQLVLGVAHQLNNPNGLVRVATANLRKMLSLLRPILDGAEAKNIETVGPYTVSELCAKMFEQTDRILGATNRIMSITDSLKRCTSAVLSEVAPVSVNELVHDLVRSHQFLIDRCGFLEVRCEQADSLRVDGHRLHLEQALSVILTNACTAIADRYREDARRKGLLRISTTRHGPHIRIEIADNGCGMDQNTLDRMFDPYFTTRPFGEGEGLGLAICRAIVTQHRGSIDVESSRGEGTHFFVTLPPSEEENGTP